MTPNSVLIVLMLGVFYPLWLLAGLTDYLCHRRTDIEHTAGMQESLLHLAQFVSLGVPAVLAVFLAATPLMFAAIAAFVVLHTVLSYVDVAYTEKRRRISPLEQHAHAFMDVLPIAAVALLAIVSWPELTSADWAARFKSEPLPGRAATVFLGSFFVLAGAPILEELWRTKKASRPSDRTR